MANRPHPAGATNDPHDGPWSTCDRCGFVYSQVRLQFQFQYRGGVTPQNTGFLVCERCLDGLQYQRSLLIIPPDPMPIMNTRPENYAIDETNYFTTTDGDIFETDSGDEYISSIPNPSQVGNTTVLTTVLTYAGTLTVAYLDLFDGDPTDGGASILETITGSATRTNVFADLEADADDVLLNPEVITVTSSSLSVSNVSYVGIYSAATGGTLLASGAVSATYPTIADGTAVQFNQLGLSIAQL